MAGPLCKKCGSRLADVLVAAGSEYHELCTPAEAFDFDEPPLQPGLASGHAAMRLRDDVTELITWADRNSERSLQKQIGASELSQCIRRIGYRLAGVPSAGNHGDPWPAIVGTGIHMWMEQAIGRFEAAHRVGRWKAEMTVAPHEKVAGHTDVYDTETFTVIDWKSKGTEEMREIRKGVITFDDAIQQVNLYGRGHERAGRRVDNVALVFMPRGGWLSGIYVWMAPYDRQLALDALDRRDKAEAGIEWYRVAEQPENWARFPAVPGKSCTWCPWHRPELTLASELGCPGK